jgi:hypothetical protein
MSTVTVSPLRQRMIEDMSARKLCAGTQRGHFAKRKLPVAPTRPAPPWPRTPVREPAGLGNRPPSGHDRGRRASCYLDELLVG